MTPAATLFDVIANDVRAEVDRVGQEIVDQVRANLSVPVQYTGGRGRIPTAERIAKVNPLVVRSVRGEHPRMETTLLVGGVEYTADANGANVSLVVADPVPYAADLDSEKMDRPILSDIPEAFEDEYVTAVCRGISKE